MTGIRHPGTAESPDEDASESCTWRGVAGSPKGLEERSGRKRRRPWNPGSIIGDAEAEETREVSEEAAVDETSRDWSRSGGG